MISFNVGAGVHFGAAIVTNSASVPGNNSGLDVAVAVQHVA
jgi:hypothetical protein